MCVGDADLVASIVRAICGIEWSGVCSHILFTHYCHSTTRLVMQYEYPSCTVRRAFLRFGIVGGLLGILGCEQGETTTATTPALPKGNRAKLDALKDKAAANAAKTPKAK